MDVLKKLATIACHTNVLHHMLGYLRQHLDSNAREKLITRIEDYLRAFVSLVVPIALFRDYVRKWDVAYLRGQVYIEPHPKELMLRNLSEGETSDVGATHLSHFDDSTENTVR